MKTVYLHIGLHKTGTSSIQNYLIHNRNRLELKNLFYPYGDKYHHFLGLHFNDKPFPKRMFEKKFSGKSSKILNEIQIVKNQMVQTDCSNIILSSESFSNSNIERLRNFLKDFNVIVVLFVRRQDLWLESRINQQFKVGLLSTKKFPKHRFQIEKTLNYLNRISQWTQVFGSKNILVQPFEKSLFNKKSLEKIFLNLLNIQPDESFEMPNRSNSSLNRSCIDFLEKKNLTKHTGHPNYKKLLSLLVKYTFEHKTEDRYKYFFSPKERIEILEKYNSSNSQVSKIYCASNGENLFKEPWPNLNDPWEPFSGITPEEELKIHQYLIQNNFRTKKLL